ncbi:hypothetical protein CYMTET_54426 [Cymbomonas tetramitiformis]|uniref:Reverse transcriptase Ty1/copia-type domain-containing protein n=1 Tax=Cymbomonas tetramitiformis TaxID=36881 RepID=A0AAE0BGD5_9CHLO|nr:hypothetical protein CYMTET_54426 [Cymbomonas tetramitiformis]
MGGTYDILGYSEMTIYRTAPPVVDHGVGREEYESSMGILVRVDTALRQLIEKEPVVVRGTYRGLRLWMARLDVATRAVVNAVEAIEELVGELFDPDDHGDTYEYYDSSDSDSDSGDGLPELMEDSDSDDGDTCDEESSVGAHRSDEFGAHDVAPSDGWASGINGPFMSRRAPCDSDEDLSDVPERVSDDDSEDGDQHIWEVCISVDDEDLLDMLELVSDDDSGDGDQHVWGACASAQGVPTLGDEGDEDDADLTDVPELVSDDDSEDGDLVGMPDLVSDIDDDDGDGGAEQHEGAEGRDKWNWRFEDLEDHDEQLGPIEVELFVSEDNEHYKCYYTVKDSAFDKCWSGRFCYGNPPYEDAIRMKCLQKALRAEPVTTRFLFVLPKWETATWWYLMSRFRVVREYSAGARIFSAPKSDCYNTEGLETCGTERVWIQGTKWPVEVVYKDCHTTEQMDAKLLQHVRLGHPGDASMSKMVEQGVPMGITAHQYEHSCVQCCPDSDGGYRWFAQFLDDAAHWMWAYFLRKKSEYLDALEAYLAEMRKHRSRLGLDEQYHMVLHTDGDSTMIVGQTADYCKRNGIEQRDGKLGNRARELRYVGHSEVSTAYLLYDAESEKVVRSGMVVFSERLDKLGAVVTSWDHLVLAPLKTNFMLTVLDAEYVESPAIHEDALVVGRSAYVPDGSDEVLAVVKLQQKQDTFCTALRVYLEDSPSRYAMLGNLDRSQNDCYPLFTEVSVDSGGEALEMAIICARALEAHAYPYCVVLLSSYTALDLPSGKVHFPTEQMCLAISSVMRGDGLLPSGVAEPKPYKQALSAPDADEWVAAVDKEMSSLGNDKRALEMVDFSDVPAEARVLNMTLILKVKLTKDRQLDRRKGRICDQGNTQAYGEDYLDTFAPCTQLSSVRLVIILALNLGLKVYHMDVETVFLNSELQEVLYVRLPSGLRYDGRNYARLRKAVYGLKQAGRAWFMTSDALIIGYAERMQKSQAEPCLYCLHDGDLWVILLCYVDDYLVASSSRQWYLNFVAAFNAQYTCKDLGELDLVMGIGVRWAPDAAYLSQKGYMLSLLSQYGLEEAKPVAIPMLRGQCWRRVENSHTGRWLGSCSGLHDT